MLLETELAYFEKCRTAWLANHAGKFALVRGEELLGVFDTSEGAYEAGVEAYGNVAFLIKQILPEDPIEESPALMYGLLHANP